MYKNGVHIIFMLVVLLVGSSSLMGTLAQTGRTTPPSWLRYQQDAAYRAEADAFDANLARLIRSGNIREDSTSEILYVPVVVHVMHLPEDSVQDDATSNLTDARIEAALELLNDAFRHRAPFDRELEWTNAKQYVSLADTRIEFQLARRDTNGNSTTGITRHATILSNHTYNATNCNGSQTEEFCLKNKARWNPQQYLNVYLVDQFCAMQPNGSKQCDLPGYSYGISAHGDLYDGVVLEAREWSDDPAKIAVAAYFFGQYLSLFHTAYPVNNNNCPTGDCLTSGDRNCDTPPENLPYGPSGNECGYTFNSCPTVEPNSPFPGDVEDMYENFMDGGDPGCKKGFTPGQMVRMRRALRAARNSLLTSPALQTSGPDVALVEIQSPTTGWCDATIIPEIVVRNTGTEMIENLEVSVSVNGSTRTWQSGVVIAVGESEVIGGVGMLGQYPLQLGVNGLGIRIRSFNNGITSTSPEDEALETIVIYRGSNQLEVATFPYEMRFDQGLTQDWLIDNPDDLVGMSIAPWDGCQSTDSLPDNLLAYDALTPWLDSAVQADRAGTREYLVGPVLDLSNYGRATLSFAVAFRRIVGRSGLTLRVLAGPLCGGPYQTIYSKDTNTLATGDSIVWTPDTRQVWRPTACEHWRQERIDLDAFTGGTIQLVFEVETTGPVPSNFYLENIKVEAQPFCNAPSAIPEAPGVYRADHICIDADGWSHFIRQAALHPDQAEDLLLFSVYDLEGSGMVIEPGQVRMVITPERGQGGHDLSQSAPYALNRYGWYSMGRYLMVSPTEQPNRLTRVRLYHDSTDLADLTQRVSNPEQFGPDRLVYYAIYGDEDPDPRNGHRHISQQVYAEWMSNDEVTATSWHESTFHPQYYSADLETNDLRFFSAGTGGDGGGFGAKYPVALSPFVGWQVRSRTYLSVMVAREYRTMELKLYGAHQGEPYQLIGTQAARGNAYSPLDYEFWHEEPTDGYTSYYAVMVHDNGMVIPSDTITVEYREERLVSTYPNPTDGELCLQIDAADSSEVELRVLDANRRSLLQHRWTHQVNEPFCLDVSSLPAGIYFYHLRNAGQVYWGKFVRVY